MNRSARYYAKVFNALVKWWMATGSQRLTGPGMLNRR